MLKLTQMTSKSHLRAQFRDLRDHLPNRAEKSRLICKILQNHPKIVDASTILLYFPIQSEVDIRPLFAQYSGQKRLALPRVDLENTASDDPKALKTLRFHLFDPKTPLDTGAFDIPEPRHTPEITNFSNAVALVPGLGFNREGYRLGYGGGFYDRFLRQHPEIYTIGLCYADCLTDEHFEEPHDISLDEIITELPDASLALTS